MQCRESLSRIMRDSRRPLISVQQLGQGRDGQGSNLAHFELVDPSRDAVRHVWCKRGVLLQWVFVRPDAFVNSLCQLEKGRGRHCKAFVEGEFKEREQNSTSILRDVPHITHERKVVHIQV